MKTIKIFLALVLTAVWTQAQTAQTVPTVVPATDSTYGLNRVPPGGGWFGRAGLPNGIPTTYNFWCDPTVSIPGSPLTVPTDGVSDCSVALQAAMNLCPSNGVVQLPPGIFYFTNAVSISAYKVLRGTASNGTNATVLKYMCVYSGQPWPNLLSISLNGYSYGSCQTVSDLVYGSNTIYLNWNTWTNLQYTYQYAITPGFIACISQTNDPTIVNVFNRYGGIANWAGLNQGSNAMCQMVLITNVTVNAAQQTVAVQVEHPFYWTFSRTNFPFLMGFAYPVNDSGIEHLRIVTLNTNKANAGGAINILYGRHCWVNDVEIDQFPRDGVFLNFCYGCQVSHCFLNVAQYNDSGDGYGYHIFGPNADILIDDNIALGCRHSMIMEAGGAGCVYAYNYCIGDNNDDESPGWVTDDCVMHASHPYMNLFEGNYMHKIGWDHQHGSSSHNTIYRNFISMALGDTNLPIQFGQPVPYTTEVSDWTISWETWNYYENAVDNVLAQPPVMSMQGHSYYDPSPNTGDGFIYRLGFDDEGGQICVDTNCAATGYMNGNFDYITGGIVWSNTVYTNFPPSLYVTSQPSWWSNGVAWPPYGGDVNPMVGILPAQLRYYALGGNTLVLPSQPPQTNQVTSTPAPTNNPSLSPPTNLRVTSVTP